MQTESLIYVADDEENIRVLIKRFLENEGYVVETFENGQSLMIAFQSRQPDMVILDIMMPLMDGLSVCSEIRSQSDVPIIMVSARDSEMDRIMGISTGSDDYLVKPFSPLELLVRMKAIFRRVSKSKTSQVLQYGDIKIDCLTREVTCSGQLLELTPTEYTLMVYLFSNSYRAVSREELLENVWSFSEALDTRVTDDSIKRLRKKLVNTHVRITAVWGFGFKLEIIS